MNPKVQKSKASEIQDICKDKVIPEEFQVPFKKTYNRYLVNGELRTWSGKTAPVYSPLYTPDKDGPVVGHTWHWDNIIVR